MILTDPLLSTAEPRADANLGAVSAQDTTVPNGPLHSVDYHSIFVLISNEPLITATGADTAKNGSWVRRGGRDLKQPRTLTLFRTSGQLILYSNLKFLRKITMKNTLCDSAVDSTNFSAMRQGCSVSLFFFSLRRVRGSLWRARTRPHAPHT